MSPDQVEYLAATTADLYAEVEQRLLALVARQLAAGMEAPGWAVAKLAAIAPLRRAADALLDVLAGQVDAEVRHVVAEAYESGRHSALAELGVLADENRRTVAEHTPQAQAVDRLTAETIETVTATHRGILRAVEDGYRQVVAEATAAPLLGTETRRQATQQAMTRFADRGVSSFRDRSGRRWALTSYAEMAVRTSVARAATEAHMTTLAAAGVDLVVVSNSPRECPLCRPWERAVLSIGGPDGPRTVDVEHAVEDGRTVRVSVAGSLDEARRAGLQHPNCRHSVSAYAPGITRTEDATPDPTGYEAGQRQRAIERKIRRYKNRAAVATTPEGKRAAEAKVRQWQGAMRDHLAAHPDLRRLRAREQRGASNLPTPTTTPPADVMQAARVRAGDDATLREMTDEQLGAAIRPGVLDRRDLDRIRTETERRDETDLLARLRPDGQLAEPLTQFSDDELAAAFPHLRDDELLRVMAELDRRDVDAALPAARRDLIGLSDRDLAERARHVDDAERAEIAAEANRRRLLAEVFPDGRLADDLSGIGDDVLGWAIRYARAEDAERIADELDRRYPPPPLPEAAGAHTIEGQLADRAAIDQALAPAEAPDEWGSLALDDGPYAGMTATERWIAEREYAAEQQRTAYTREEIREMYREHVYAQLLAAEEATNGYLLSAKARADGVDPITLFSGPAHVAYARASEELKRWWQDHPRLTLAEYTEQITGVQNTAADTARKSRGDQQNRL
ncbi:phage minor capsid protein [Streptomyces malaysiensis]|uniref:Phage minor capsid protein n=1 Tax=Streptomyces malaysiensis subsp. samsunensis TaxID=459658 RepID=A0A9X2LUJ9_STRMQ|nr:phage minor capsid protein [Streptomyces samsunensis]MCQ8829852.1 phage minor capsid protein [Streptomyces samsunensis]